MFYVTDVPYIQLAIWNHEHRSIKGSRGDYKTFLKRSGGPGTVQFIYYYRFPDFCCQFKLPTINKSFKPDMSVALGKHSIINAWESILRKSELARLLLTCSLFIPWQDASKIEGRRKAKRWFYHFGSPENVSRIGFSVYRCGIRFSPGVRAWNQSELCYSPAVLVCDGVFAREHEDHSFVRSVIKSCCNAPPIRSCIARYLPESKLSHLFVYLPERVAPALNMEHSTIPEPPVLAVDDNRTVVERYTRLKAPHAKDSVLIKKMKKRLACRGEKSLRRRRLKRILREKKLAVAYMRTDAEPPSLWKRACFQAF